MDEATESTELLIHFDESKCKYHIEALENFIPDFFETAISKFNKLGIGTFKKENFSELFLTPKEFLFKQLMRDKPLNVAGMKVSKEKLFDLLEKPIGYFTLIAEIKTLQDKVNKLSPWILYSSNLEYFLSLFEFGADDKIQLTNEIKEEIKRKNEVYVSKESSKAMYKFLKSLEKLFNESDIFIKNILPYSFDPGSRFIYFYLNFDHTGRKFSINLERMKAHDREARY